MLNYFCQLFAPRHGPSWATNSLLQQGHDDSSDAPSEVTASIVRVAHQRGQRQNDDLRQTESVLSKWAEKYDVLEAKHYKVQEEECVAIPQNPMMEYVFWKSDGTIVGSNTRVMGRFWEFSAAPFRSALLQNLSRYGSSCLTMAIYSIAQATFSDFHLSIEILFNIQQLPLSRFAFRNHLQMAWYQWFQ